MLTRRIHSALALWFFTLMPRAAAACSFVALPPGVNPFAQDLWAGTLALAATGAAALLALALWARTRRGAGFVLTLALLFAVHPRWWFGEFGDCGTRFLWLNFSATAVALVIAICYAAFVAVLDARARGVRSKSSLGAAV